MVFYLGGGRVLTIVMDVSHYHRYSKGSSSSQVRNRTEVSISIVRTEVQFPPVTVVVLSWKVPGLKNVSDMCIIWSLLTVCFPYLTCLQLFILFNTIKSILVLVSFIISTLPPTPFYLSKVWSFYKKRTSVNPQSLKRLLLMLSYFHRKNLQIK